MADDTRQPSDLSREALTVSPENKPFTGTQWQNGKSQPYTAPPENANMMAGGTEHTAGGKTPDVTLGNAFQGGLKWNDFMDLPKRPCVRDALMTGIGGGFALGGMRAIFGAAVWTSCTWAVGSFCLGAPAMYQYCLYQRQAEKEGMMRAVEILNKKDVEKKAREARKEKLRQERRKEKDVELDAQFAALNQAKPDTVPGGSGKAWWKVW
ncbi:hypothetical protein LTR85_000958 [Meristemomyces frigidus]|nr:hypothetical protein LTR85_000958 [Meristemomyces frigidus]